MVLPAFASIEELDARRPAGVASHDHARAQAALEDVSALIRTEVNKNYVDDANALVADVPDIFRSVACAAARRALDNPDGIQQEAETLGPYSNSRTYANSSGDVYLTAAERRLVRKAAGVSAIFTIPTTREPDNTVGLDTANVLCGPNGDEYLPVEPEGEPILWGGPA